MAVIKLDPHDGQPQRYSCLSTDTKPDATTEEGLEAGAELYEADTGQKYWWDGASWQHGLIVIPTEHHRIHNGQAFFASHLFTSVANDAAVNVLIQANAGMHSLWNVAAGGDFDIEVFTGATFSNQGTVVPHFNHNQYSTNGSDSIISHTPTITGAGTSLGAKLLPGGTAGNASGGEDGSFGRETILKSDTDYLIRATNRSGVTKRASVTLDWYQYTTT